MSDNDRYFEQRATEIKQLLHTGQAEKAADLTVLTAMESGFTGPDQLADTFTALSAATRRLRSEQ